MRGRREKETQETADDLHFKAKTSDAPFPPGGPGKQEKNNRQQKTRGDLWRLFSSGAPPVGGGSKGTSFGSGTDGNFMWHLVVDFTPW